MNTAEERRAAVESILRRMLEATDSPNPSAFVLNNLRAHIVAGLDEIRQLAIGDQVWVPVDGRRMPATIVAEAYGRVAVQIAGKRYTRKDRKYDTFDPNAVYRERE